MRGEFESPLMGENVGFLVGCTGGVVRNLCTRYSQTSMRCLGGAGCYPLIAQRKVVGDCAERDFHTGLPVTL